MTQAAKGRHTAAKGGLAGARLRGSDLIDDLPIVQYPLPPVLPLQADDELNEGIRGAKEISLAAEGGLFGDADS